MPSIHKNLVLDHLYVSTNDEEFEEIKQIFLRLQCTSHQVVEADDDSWEGVYVSSRGRHYLEFLRNRRSLGMGLCQRAYGQLSQDARHIVHDFPDLPWKTFERSFDGIPWFTALSCDNYLDLATPFNTWVMQYHQYDGQETYPLGKCEISLFHELSFSANPDLIDKVKLNSSWFHGKSEINSQEARFELQTHYSDPFLLHITFDNKGPGFQFKKATMSFEHGFDFPELRLKHFDFLKDKNRYILERKPHRP